MTHKQLVTQDKMAGIMYQVRRVQGRKLSTTTVQGSQGGITLRLKGSRSLLGRQLHPHFLCLALLTHPHTHPSIHPHIHLRSTQLLSDNVLGAGTWQHVS